MGFTSNKLPVTELPILSSRDWINRFRLDLKFSLGNLSHRLRLWRYLRCSPELELVAHFADPERASLDVGANLGLFTEALAKCSNHVYAVEPSPLPLRALRRLRRCDVTILPIALSSRSGYATLLVPRNRKGWTSNGARLDHEASPMNSVAAELNVPCSRIDDLDLPALGLIKIDVEGHEYAVLQGGKATLERDRPVLIIEQEAIHTGKTGHNYVFTMLCELGYRGYALKGKRILPLSSFSIERDQERFPTDGTRQLGYIKNFLFLPD